MHEKLNIFAKPHFDNTIERVEEHAYYPATKSFQNNDTAEIEINQEDTFLDLQSATVEVNGKFNKTDATDVLTFNFILFLWEYMIYSLNGKEIEKVKEPGLTSTIYMSLVLNAHQISSLNQAGTNPASILHTDGTFMARFPLTLVFGLFRDCKKFFIGKHRLTFVRAKTDDNCYITTKETKSTITINEIVLKVNHVFFHDVVRLPILKNINKNFPITMAFRKWTFLERPSLSNGTKEIWRPCTTTEMGKPRWVIVGFQDNRKDNSKANSFKFDALDMKHVRVHLNSRYYPMEHMRLNFKEKQVTSAYEMYRNFQINYLQKEYPETYLNYETFLADPLYVFDCSKQPEGLPSSTVDVKIEMETGTAFPTTARAYCVIIYDAIFEMYPLTKIVREVFE